MRILHLVPSLTREAERAVADLIHQQREHGHVVATVEAHAWPPAPATRHDHERIEVVHAHGLSAAAAVSIDLAAWPQRPPLVVTAHEWLADAPLTDLHTHRETLQRAARVTTPSAVGRTVAIAAGAATHRTRVIPYPIDLAPRLEVTDRQLDDEVTAWRTRGGDVLCAVSHHDHGAYQDVVTEALSCVTQPESLLCVWAGRVNRRSCESVRAARGPAARPRLTASIESARAIAARSDYLVLPGFDQRRPFALAEAWCDGVPVLAGRNARFADLDTTGFGTVFFDPADPMDLARAIATVRGTTSASRRLLIERARAQYRAQFAPAAVFAAYEATYAEVLAGRNVDAA